MIWVGGELLEPQLFEIDTAAFISVVPAMEQAVERASLRQLSDADLLASVVEAANPVMRQQSGNASSE
jgi:50S ribosomal subunit-associated GTPase HflX